MEEDDLDQRLADPGFTPSAKVVPRLLTRIAAEDSKVSKLAAAALARIQMPVVDRITRNLETVAAGEPRAKIVLALLRRVGRGEDEALRTFAQACIRDESTAMRKAAARLLAKIAGDESASVLEDALKRAESESEQRTLLRSLAASGSERARVHLENAKDLHPAIVRARLAAERESTRMLGSSSLQLNTPFPEHARSRIVATCRRGLEEILAAEAQGALAATRIRYDIMAGLGRVEMTFNGSLAKLAKLRVALNAGVGFECARHPGESAVEVVSRALAERQVTTLLRSYTEGPIRFRLAWADGGKHRATTWGVAESLRASQSELVNDPTQSDWEIVVHLEQERVLLDVFPKHEDPRFAYRVREVPAASHPTIAAALARELGVVRDDVIWDPFVGSGLELCERAQLGDYALLLGSDVDPTALSAARANLQSAGVDKVELRREDSGAPGPLPALTGMISNPPMGRRVLSGGDLERLLVNVVACAADHLEPGGRIVLLSPQPRATGKAAERAGLELTRESAVDMGGFDATLQHFVR